ncbi:MULTISPECIES: hypothetical protein [Pseudomonas syringae group]|uniref:Uncharacterized protein n=2 Tax=Pseudomonas syringae group TaxID=136849 RepID=A0A0P9LLK2_9PSED|nr:MULTISPECIES: hypothetical protein [Pseudomonas syringae group]KPW71271.1 hypothetical protein ALO76_101420 [Pseudomonas syringae pv. coriandricola]RMN09687.1 hypothetical protein ALQ65_101322 [Pseudomonas syringae pv. coriandricola]
MIDYSTLIMANHPNLLPRLCQHFSDEYTVNDGRTPWWVLRSIVSSPRLADVYVKGFDPAGCSEVGDSFLDKHTMLADRPQRTYGVSLERWGQISASLTVVDTIPFRDSTISRIQIWPFDPLSLTLEAMKIAVAVSYTALELIREPRLVGAINNVLHAYNFQADPHEQ